MTPTHPIRNAQVLLTGATGFVGKVVLAELMRRRKELGVETVWLLVRGKKDKTAQERFAKEIAASPCFGLLADDWQRHCRVVDGELTRPDCGVSAEDLEQLQSRLTHVVHCAASIEFDLPIAEAAAANITSSLHVLELARQCQRLRHMVAVSTAYVTPHRPGVIPEALVDLPRPATAIYRGILDGTLRQDELLRETGHPNTYTYTKCVAEHLLTERRGHVPLTIVRPSIVSASWRQPFPGWIDSAAAFAGFVALIGAGRLRVIAADKAARLDVVPVDVVAQRVLDSAFTPDPPATHLVRYAVAGMRNSCRIDTCYTTIQDFFRAHPVDQQPAVLHVGSPSPHLRLREWQHHEAPTRLARTWFALSRQQKMGRSARKLAEKLNYLNRAFPYFTHHTFDFRAQEPFAHADFRREEYIESVCRGVYRHLMKRDETEMSLAGRQHRDHHAGDLAFALAQPDGNWAIRTFAVAVRKALRQCTNHVTFDRPSFEAAVKAVPPGARMVVIPTHRSYMDFLLCSYLFFARRDLGIDIPHIAAAEEFSRIPILGQLFKQTHAFYIKRGQGKADVQLTEHVHDLVRRGKTLQFFIEGQRSRSRQFLPPRTGLLRCLQGTGETFALLPIALTYDRVPEEESLLRELHGQPKADMKLRSLLAWSQRMARGEISLGRVHLTCGQPVLMTPSAEPRQIAREVMAELQRGTVTTTYHLRSFVAHNPLDGLTVEFLREAIVRRGGTVVDSPLGDETSLDRVSEQCLRYNWMHLFYADAVALWPDHPAVAHHTGANGYAGRHEPSAAELRDPRLRGLLRALFEPVGQDYATVADKLGTPEFAPRHASPRSLLYEVPMAHLPHIQAAFEDLAQRAVLVPDPVHGGYTWGPRAGEIEAYKRACTWPDDRVAEPEHTETAAWRRAVGA